LDLVRQAVPGFTLTFFKKKLKEKIPTLFSSCFFKKKKKKKERKKEEELHPLDFLC
jgi:hypothetical protein